MCKWRGMKMAVKTPLSVIWTLPPRRRGRTALFTAAAVAVVMSSLNVSNAVDNDVDLHFFCDKAVRHKYCGGGGGGHREWVHSYHVSVIQLFCVVLDVRHCSQCNQKYMYIFCFISQNVTESRARPREICWRRRAKAVRSGPRVPSRNDTLSISPSFAFISLVFGSI